MHIRQCNIRIGKAFDCLPVTEHVQTEGFAHGHALVALSVDIEVNVATVNAVLFKTVNCALIERSIAYCQIFCGDYDFAVLVHFSASGFNSGLCEKVVIGMLQITRTDCRTKRRVNLQLSAHYNFCSVCRRRKVSNNISFGYGYFNIWLLDKRIRQQE